MKILKKFFFIFFFFFFTKILFMLKKNCIFLDIDFDYCKNQIMEKNVKKN